MKYLLLSLASGVLALALACGAAPTATPLPPTAPPATVAERSTPATAIAPTATPIPRPPSPTSGPSHSALLERARPLVERAFARNDAADIVALLQRTTEIADQQQQFEQYLGAWQLMRMLYVQGDRKPDQKAAMDVVEEVAKTYPQYREELFTLEKK
ncbi:MAG: hypothetical protein HYY04_00930 [Chloroflexi bacterium]|nr:hypothetical protein [Chloroflexota bacterium]